MQIEVAQRIKDLPQSYVFADIAKRKKVAAEAGLQMLDFGIGDPTFGAPPQIVEKIAQLVREKINHRYPDTEGTQAYREAWASLYERDWDVSLNPDTQVCHAIGGKEAIGHFPLAFVNPGEVVIVPDPAYPVYDEGTLLAGGIPYYVPLLPENGFLPDVWSIPAEVASGAKVIWLNYPNNPTGAIASQDDFARVVDWAKTYNVIVCHDLTYSHINEVGVPTPSFLQVPGAIEVGVEFHSVSKMFSFTGARCGVVVGNEQLVAGLKRVKQTLDSGGSKFIDLAFAAHLLGCDKYVKELNDHYTPLRRAGSSMLESLGFVPFNSGATFYGWARNPEGFSSSEELAHGLIEKTGVVVTPGNGLGREQGEGFTRLSYAAASKETIERAEPLIRRFLAENRR